MCKRRVCSLGCPPLFEMHYSGRLKAIFRSLDRILMTIGSQSARFWRDLQSKGGAGANGAKVCPAINICVFE